MTEVVGRRLLLMHPAGGSLYATASEDNAGVFVRFPGGAADLSRLVDNGWRYAVLGAAA